MNVHLTSPSLGEESTLIWKTGLGYTGHGSVLVNLARSGYTHESLRVIEVSRSASLVGLQNEGGLPELWNFLVHIKGRQGITRLMAVCICRGSLSIERARSLIRDHHADVNAVDDFGRTALHFALGSMLSTDAWKERNPINADLVRVLLEFQPVLKDTAFVDAASRAAILGLVDLFQVLIQLGHNVNSKGTGGWTALHTAASRGHLSLVELLLSNGADINAKNDHGLSVLDVTKNVGDVLEFLQAYILSNTPVPIVVTRGEDTAPGRQFHLDRDQIDSMALPPGAARNNKKARQSHLHLDRDEIDPMAFIR